MQILQNMDPDKLIIILPTALVAMYIIISVQKSLCERQNPYVGLILPALCFIASTVLAFKPLLADNADQLDGLFLFCIRMWLTFNIATLVFLFPYYRQRKVMRQAAEEAQNQQKNINDIQESELPSSARISGGSADGSKEDANGPQGSRENARQDESISDSSENQQ